MEIEKYNISKSNPLDSNVFIECHKLIDSIEDFVSNYISLCTNKKTYISPTAKIHKSAVIGDSVFIGRGVEIGPYCFIKSNVILLSGVRIGYSVELDRCLLFERVKIAHNACVGRCIIGRGSNLAYNFVIATRNIQKNEIKSFFEDEIFQSTRKHHGAVIGEGFKTGVNVSIMPGATIGHEVTVRNNNSVLGYIASKSTL